MKLRTALLAGMFALVATAVRASTLKKLLRSLAHALVCLGFCCAHAGQ